MPIGGVFSSIGGVFTNLEGVPANIGGVLTNPEGVPTYIGGVFSNAELRLDNALQQNTDLQLQLKERNQRIAELEKEVLLLQRDNQTLREVLEVKK